MSGESTARTTANVAAFERAFGDSARCNRCSATAADYRVIATFLHDTVAVRSYCATCYPEALEGEYHTRGDGALMSYDEFSRRFGPAGPAPPPCTAVDRMLTRLIRTPSLRSLAPASEAQARRARATPYRFRVVLEVEGTPQSAEIFVTPEGRVQGIEGDPRARASLADALR